MRGIFGLAGILVVLGVIVWFMGHGGLDHTQQTLKTNEKLRDEVNQIAGNDPNTGERASKSAQLDALTNSGKLTGMLVSSIKPGGAYEHFFGLQRNDTIVAVEYQGLRNNIRDMTTEEDGRLQVEETFMKQGSVYVLRDGKEIKLPAPVKSPGAAPKKDSIQGTLDAIQSAPR